MKVEVNLIPRGGGVSTKREMKQVSHWRLALIIEGQVAEGDKRNEA